MESTYDFLVALGLDESAQERDIRRAYARRLKQIDQELDPAAFQALRDAYEVALDWARWKLAQDGAQASAEPPADDGATPDAPSPLASAPESTPEVEGEQPPDAAQLGATVYHRFLEAAGKLVVLPKHGEVAAWRAAIEARFADEELFNIDARIYFEAYIASLLASGWRPGHEVLFVAAQEAFGWAEDPRGLRQLGQAGRMLDQAIEERRLFDAQQATDRARMRDLIKMLRQQELPSTRRIRAAMKDVERILGRFPAFMEVVAGMENVERWRSVYREWGGAPIVLEGEAWAEPPPPEESFLSRHGAGIFILAVVVLAGIFNSGRDKDKLDTPRPASYKRFDQASGVPRIADAVLREAVPTVRYTPPPGKDRRDLEVVYKVFLNVDGKVERVQNWQTSGEPGFDQAVGIALRNAKPFPLETPREFEVRYTGDMTRPGAAQRTQADMGVPAPAPAPLTLDLLRKHLPKVQFKPAPDAKPGDYNGTYKVKLGRDGKVLDVEVAKSSGDPGLDQAVKDAVGKAKPFAPGTASFQFTYGTTIFRKERPPEAPVQRPQDAPPEPEQPPAESN
ncbi:TonB family protein [Massilia sp. 9I]|uniref:TonB family protein n=1 Tax=Massilia sp. 9I TaxID=2653152 RepID=UPI0012F04CD1|nr:TonB family protein [Massilia sp. 9I]VXB49337.1 putative TonB C-terminal domain-containing protein [Massilia sp. 9I]